MKIDKVKVYDLEESIEASKYPMVIDVDNCNDEITNTVCKLGQCEIGSGHGNYLNGIRVAFNLTASEKFWPQIQRYHFIDFVSSQSTMHRITKFNIEAQCNKYVDRRIIYFLEEKVNEYNRLCELQKQEYNADRQFLIDEQFNKIIYNVPSGFELTARLTTDYQQLKTIYYQRRNHRLKEWRDFCDWILTLPHFKELCIKEEN